MTENERGEVGCVPKNEASPVLALMVQMRLGERMCVCVCVRRERERASEEMQEGWTEGVRAWRLRQTRAHWLRLNTIWAGSLSHPSSSLRDRRTEPTTQQLHFQCPHTWSLSCHCFYRNAYKGTFTPVFKTVMWSWGEWTFECLLVVTHLDCPDLGGAGSCVVNNGESCSLWAVTPSTSI